MPKDEIAKMLDRGDLYGAFVRLGRLWIGKDHPDAEYAAIAVHVADGVPDVITVVLPPRRGPSAA